MFTVNSAFVTLDVALGQDLVFDSPRNELAHQLKDQYERGKMLTIQNKLHNPTSGWGVTLSASTALNHHCPASLDPWIARFLARLKSSLLQATKVSRYCLETNVMAVLTIFKKKHFTSIT